MFMEASMGITSRRVTEAPKKATNVSISETLLAEAKELQINVSRAAEAGIDRAIADKRAEIWLRENLEALQSSNEYVERNGLPLEKYRLF
jgi:antitoxin CcdA